MLQKTMVDMVTMHAVLDKAKSGITTADDWDKAAAFFFGSGANDDTKFTT